MSTGCPQKAEQCSCALHSSGVSQSLQELEFERGIWSAAMDGDIERVQKLLVNVPSPSIPDSAGYTALHYASRSGHENVCELLLSSGANVNSQTPGGVTALHRASYMGQLGVVKCLLRYKADPGLTDSDGRNALHKAAERGHMSVAEVLVSAAPKLSTIKDKHGRLPKDLIKDSNTQWDKVFSLSNTS